MVEVALRRRGPFGFAALVRTGFWNEIAIELRLMICSTMITARRHGVPAGWRASAPASGARSPLLLAARQTTDTPGQRP